MSGIFLAWTAATYEAMDQSGVIDPEYQAGFNKVGFKTTINICYIKVPYIA